MNIYEIRCRHLDKQHDNNKNTGSVGSINKICYIKKAIKKANDSLFKKSLRVEGAKPVRVHSPFGSQPGFHKHYCLLACGQLKWFSRQ